MSTTLHVQHTKVTPESKATPMPHPPVGRMSIAPHTEKNSNSEGSAYNQQKNTKGSGSINSSSFK